ncbi:MAG: hypothetical protein MUF13_07265 [Akkermansiaceae bacterium]|jgi:hypothetical protein|nr:hypothetical protein [Akkermansiaceae bacterium]
MKTIVSIALVTGLACTAHAQGPLVPPGAPAPSMKTLTQIEPRTDVLRLAGDAGAQHVISSPGSYYLTGEISSVSTPVAIRITASHVTLDLGGFRIHGDSASNRTGIQLSGNLENVRIHNGILSTFQNLITVASGSPGANTVSGAVVESIQGSGFNGAGIHLGSTASNRVENCVLVGGLAGIHAGSIVNCHVATAIPSAIAISAYSRVSQSSGIATGTGSVGISAADCEVSHAKGQGTSAGLIGGNVANSRGISTLGIGIDATGNVSQSEGSSIDETGIFSEGSISDSIGRAGQGFGLWAGGNVANSTGIVEADGIGIRSLGSVSNSTGEGVQAWGILAEGTVSHSSGSSRDDVLGFVGVGIGAKIIHHSHGDADGGTGLQATLAVGSTSTGADIIDNRYLMP